MNTIILSIKPILSAYKTEAVFLAASIVSLIFSLIIVINNNTSYSKDLTYSFQDKPKTNASTNQKKSTIVEISGAVNKPGVYEAIDNARLVDMIALAGGLAPNADTGYFEHYFNLARLIHDQEKIYIPTIYEVTNGLYPLSNTSTENNSFQNDNSNELININTASLNDLDTLSGIGAVTAQKIIQSRPYASLDELVSKKVIYQSTFEKIKNQITL